MTRPCRGVFRAVLAALGLLLAVSEVRAEQYKILVTGARISPKKQLPEGQKDWDVGGNKPDPYVAVEIDGSSVFVSGKEQDTLEPRWFTGTAYWAVPKTAKVRITVRDADLGKSLARVGIAGVTVHPDIPDFGKRFLNDALRDVDTDDTVAIWSGTLQQLIDACGGVGKHGDVLKDAGAKQRLTYNIGLEGLTVRVIERPNEFDIRTPTVKSYIGLTAATFERVKRGVKLPWDVGVGAAQNPDPRYVIYVNGEPVVAGATNPDSFVAAWDGELPALHLEPDDIIAIVILDADAGTVVAGAGKHALLFSNGLSKAAKQQLFEELSKASTDDPAFIWVGTWAALKAKGDSFTLPGGATDTGVWFNDGLASATVVTANKPPAAAGAPVDLVVQRATIKPTKADGKAWDLGAANGAGRPDPFVKVFVANPNGGWDLLATSAVVKDSFTADWKLRVSDKRLVPGRKVKFEVYDEDLASHDMIGTIVIALPEKPAMLKEKGDQIEELEVNVERP
jgi:hypothetical protein